MSFGAKQIKIKIETNIPNQSDDLVLSKDILYHPDMPSLQNLSLYPFITENVKIPSDVLQRKPYKERVKTFFRKERFLKLLDDFAFDRGNADEDILMHNVKVMIELLFPTIFPLINDNRTSHDRFILNKSSSAFTLKGSIPRMISWMFPNLQIGYSYIKVKGKVYTVSYTMILNDVLHHPRYQKLLSEYQTFLSWKNQKLVDIRKLIDDKTVFLKKIIGSTTGGINIDVFKQLKDQIDNYLNATSSSTSYKVREEFSRHQALNKMKETLDEIIKLTSSANRIDKDIISLLSVVSHIFAIEKRIFTLNTSEAKRVDQILDSSDEINMLTIIKEEYFERGINGDIEQSSSDNTLNKIKSYLNKHYPKYVEFIQLLKSFNNTNVETSNTILKELLQNIITEDGSSKITKVLNNILTAQFSDSDAQIVANTGVDKSQSSKENTSYETTVFLFVIGGELNDDNISKIKCDYFDYDLGRAYKLMKTPLKYELEREKKSYYDLNDLFKGIDVQEKGPVEQQPPSSSKQESDTQKTKKGGKCVKRNRTKRNHSWTGAVASRACVRSCVGVGIKPTPSATFRNGLSVPSGREWKNCRKEHTRKKNTKRSLYYLYK